MFECLILGDSIAQGIAQANSQCRAVVKSGINSNNWFDRFQYNPFYRDNIFRVVVISLGTNDFDYDNTEENLIKIRVGSRGQIVVWILPSETLKPAQRQTVIKVAEQFGDKVLDIGEFVGPDGIHPNSLQAYKNLSKNILNLQTKD